jgi:hypothetical protein
MATLDDKPFDEAVKVHGALAGQARNIGSTRETAEWLLYKWPQELDTAKARAARRACLEEGQRRRRQPARPSAAAEEAGILIAMSPVSHRC